MVGHNDGGHDTYLTLEVHVDQEKVLVSGDMKKGEPAKPLDTSMEGAEEIKLVVTNGRDRKPEGNHSDWAHAFLAK